MIKAQKHVHRMGVCNYENGSKYEGEFANDKRAGWGLIEMKNGEQYEGEWEDDTIQGAGYKNIAMERSCTMQCTNHSPLLFCRSLLN